MKRYLLPEKGQFYKANLHCHTTVSDGKWSPEKVKRIYRSQGYSIVAFTDHGGIIPHPELRDEAFLPLNGMEVEIPSPVTPDSFKKRPWVHLCLIAKEEDNVKMPFYHRSLYIKYNEEMIRGTVLYDESKPDYVREWDVEKVNEAISLAKSQGFFVTYNHPDWSFEDATRITKYEGLDALEFWNSSCVMNGYCDSTPAIYNATARHGMRLFPVAADDNHNPREFDDPFQSACGGWVQIKAEELSYPAVTRAMEKGEFYASIGPEIHGLWTENGEIHVTCSPATRVYATFVGGKCLHVFGEKGPISEASFPLDPHRGGVRITVYDENGKYATTRFYYPEEW